MIKRALTRTPSPQGDERGTRWWEPTPIPRPFRRTMIGRGTWSFATTRFETRRSSRHESHRPVQDGFVTTPHFVAPKNWSTLSHHFNVSARAEQTIGKGSAKRTCCSLGIKTSEAERAQYGNYPLSCSNHSFSRWRRILVPQQTGMTGPSDRRDR